MHNVDGVTARILIDLNRYNYLVKNSGLQQQRGQDVDSEDGDDYGVDDDNYYETADSAHHSSYGYGGGGGGAMSSHHYPSTPDVAAIQYQTDYLAAHQNDLSNSMLAQQQAAQSASSPMTNYGGSGNEEVKKAKKKATSTPTMNAVMARKKGSIGGGRGASGDAGGEKGGRVKKIKKAPTKVVKMGERWFSLGSLK